MGSVCQHTSIDYTTELKKQKSCSPPKPFLKMSPQYIKSMQIYYQYSNQSIKIDQLQKPNQQLDDNISFEEDSESIQCLKSASFESDEILYQMDQVKSQYCIESSARNIQRPINFLSQKQINVESSLPTVRINSNMFIKVREQEFSDFYSIEKCIGIGSYGTVYRVKHKSTSISNIYTDQPRAMKQISKLLKENKVLKEMDLLIKLDHPNIIKPIELFEDAQHYQMITEQYQLFNRLLNGGDIQENLVIDKLTEQQTAKNMKQILYAVAYLHNLNIVHRDIKPENIIYSTNHIDSPIKIIDFGISIKIKPYQKIKQKIGTLFYMAPEIFHANYDQQCDIWSCGVTMYYMLTGHKPFKGNSDNDVINAISKGYINYEIYCKEISEIGKQFLQYLLKIKPEHRFSAKQALQHPWIRNLAPDFILCKTIILKLTEYNNKSRSQQLLLALATHFIPNIDENILLQFTFFEMDQDLDGRISKDELIQSLGKLYNDQVKAVLIADQIFGAFNKKDFEFISYAEYIASTIAQDKLKNKKFAKLLFQIFDVNQDGYISQSDFEHVIGRHLKLWRTFLQQLDRNHDGALSEIEFSKLFENYQQINTIQNHFE